MTTHLTLLSGILGGDFPLALERQRVHNIRFLDLKDGIWGKVVEELNLEEAERAAALIAEFGLEVHCFSTSIGCTSLKNGTTEADFRARHDAKVENAIRVAEIMRPRVIRLLMPRLAPEKAGEIATQRMLREFPWMVSLYREWVDAIEAAGFGVLIENESWGCVLASVADVTTFFEALNRPTARYTWDVQNLWQNGTFPSLEVYARLKPLIGAVHLKGGRGENGQLEWAAPLDEASWPVLEIVRAVVKDGVAPFICLNPSHGKKPDGWNGWEVAQREMAWLRSEIQEIQ